MIEIRSLGTEEVANDENQPEGGKEQDDLTICSLYRGRESVQRVGSGHRIAKHVAKTQIVFHVNGEKSRSTARRKKPKAPRFGRTRRQVTTLGGDGRSIPLQPKEARDRYPA